MKFPPSSLFLFLRINSTSSCIMWALRSSSSHDPSTLEVLATQAVPWSVIGWRETTLGIQGSHQHLTVRPSPMRQILLFVSNPMLLHTAEAFPVDTLSAIFSLL
jgi:hypothetical protein